MNDALGDRIKSQYEDRTRTFLPRRTYTVIRVDGKAFHTLTRGFSRPFDRDLETIMDLTAIRLCEEVQGAKFAFVQSDEISLLLTDFETPTTCAWYDGNVQKMASVSAAIATAEFNKALLNTAGLNVKAHVTNDKFLTNGKGVKTAYFDSRVFTIPDVVEVENYFIWRQNDASRNSVQMAARAVYGHKQLEGQGIPQLHDLLHAKGINWNDYPTGEKRGRIIKKEKYWVASPNDGEDNVERSRWVSFDGRGCNEKYEIPIFTQNRNFLRDLIPTIEGFDFDETKKDNK